MADDVADAGAREGRLPGDYEHSVLKYVIANVPHSIFWKDRDGRFLGGNQNFLNDLGVPRIEDILGKTDYDMGFPKEQADFFVECDRRVMETGEPLLDIEEPQFARGGRPKFLLTSKVPLRDEAGRVTGLLGIYADITERKRAEVELGRAKDAAEAAARAKTDFLTTISHELRTPLTLILGPLEQVLATEDLPAPVRAELERMLRNATRLRILVSDVLDFGKLEAGKMAVARGNVDVARLVGRIADDARSLAERRGLQLGLRAEPVGVVSLDRGKFEKIVLNLVGNALKFTPPGGRVDVTVRVVEGELELAVADTGPGIAPAQHALLFQRFQQIDSSSTRRHEGTGLGLALVREFAELMGGRAGVESSPGDGSRFFVRLPLERPAGRARSDEDDTPTTTLSTAMFVADPEEPPRPRATGKRPRLLFADDNADLRSHVRTLLDADFDVETVANGRLALAAARAHPPDVILSDIMMPEMDGLQLARALKADAQLAAVPVILLTARADTGDVVAGLEGGADEYLAKPFGPSELKARLRAALRLRRAYQAVEERNQELRRALARLEEAQGELVHREKMALTGTLVAELSHELNNPVSAILIHAQTLVQSAPAGSAMARSAGAIERQARRCGERLRTLLDFARKRAETPEATTAREVLERVVELCRPGAERGEVALAVEPGAALDAAFTARLGSLDAALVNLVANAVDAVGRGGHVTLGARLTDDGAVELTVADDGPGIPGEVAPRIFDPFFTTKPLGKGTGLGLSLARKFVEDQGGTLGFDTGQAGTTMRVRLPAGAPR